MKTGKTRNSITLAVNIPADGLFLAILNRADGDFSKANCTRIIKNYIDRHLEANPDIILLNVCYRRCLTPSDVFDSYLYNIETDENGQKVKVLSPVTDGVSKYFSSFFSCARILLQNGIDIYKILTEYIREKGCRVYFSIRMNDGHYTDNPAINSGFALKNNGAHTINRDGAALDFSQKEVRNYFYQYIDELLQNYVIDGVELDWLRYPVVLPSDKRCDYRILNSYMQEIRNLVNKYNNDLGLAVRVLPNEQDNLDNGVDLCQWIADGTVDSVTIENFYIPSNFEMPVLQWKTNIEKRNVSNHPYQLLCGSDWAVSCVQGYNIPMTPALIRGFANECIANGADGIYLFNFFEENDTSSFEFVNDDAEGPYLKNCFAERMKAAKQFDKLPHRYVHIGSSNKRYPIVIPPDSFYKFNYHPKAAFCTCKMIVGCNTDMPLFVSVNNVCSKIALQKEQIPEGFEYIPASEIGKKSAFIYSVSQAAPFVKSAILPVVKNELLEIYIQNTSEQDVNILWAELYFE